jgi:hypothetical protein
VGSCRFLLTGNREFSSSQMADERWQKEEGTGCKDNSFPPFPGGKQVAKKLSSLG